MFLSKHSLVLSLLLITAASPVASAVKAFETKDDLQAAVDSYCADAFDDESTYGSIENWDVSRITNMYFLFSGKTSCNPNIGSWDVSKVTNFQSMFNNARAFNKDISNWDVSSGTNFIYMFAYANAFNQDISNWDVSSGTTFEGMFDYAYAFNQPPLYCKWQTNDTFKNTTPNPCLGSVSCGWGQSECFKCVNSPLQFQVKTEGGSLLPYSCEFAAQNKDKFTCSNEGKIATHCPDVCGTCSEYGCSDSEGVFFMGSGKKKRECSWLQQMSESRRIKQCKKPKFAQTCRDTCKFCE
eukprot:CAMPEP_0194095246 /NCGR_PEP_ID=MMETSP0149-20130528/56729_1 /TAXON_ID=122233 /ORGANISM="Chaetoceros debilis, Strain MM31A-1" /LENGTH=295 /DNA_ID=CAMNT_0038781187 /DNA_START=134 /DNA_END=1021 /DNA_ORIENTATION=-